MIEAVTVRDDPERLLNPRNSAWGSIVPTRLPLVGTPAPLQPTDYTRNAWAKRSIGAVDFVELRCCHDSNALYTRLEWVDRTEDKPGPDSEEFPDSAAVMFPVGEDAPLITMGSERQPVNAWQWRADATKGRSVTAAGLGTTEATDDIVSVGVDREGERWILVLSRSLAARDGGVKSVSLVPGGSTRVAVAVWDGNHRERGGFKAYSATWTDLKLE